MPDEIEAPEEFPPEAWESDGESLTQDQLAARIATKREEAAQDAGWIKPPGPDDELEQVDEVAEEERSEEEPPEEGEEEEQPDETAPPEEEETPEDEELKAEEEDFYVGRYKSKDAAEEGLREKDATIDRLFRELHDQRQQTEQALQEHEQVGPQQLDVAQWHEWAAEAVENGAGVQGALQALQQGGREGYNIYLAHWLEDETQRPQAAAFNNEVLLEYAEMRARQAVAPFIADREAEDAQTQAENARANVARSFEDFEDYADEMDRLISEPGAISEDDKIWLAEMARDGQAGKERAWKHLYLLAARTSAPRRAEAKKVETRRRRASGDRARVEATVSSAEGVAARTPSRTRAEDAALERKNAIREEWGLEPVEVD
jgi:hypothetical protein